MVGQAHLAPHLKVLDRPHRLVCLCIKVGVSARFDVSQTLANHFDGSRLSYLMYRYVDFVYQAGSLQLDVPRPGAILHAQASMS